MRSQLFIKTLIISSKTARFALIIKEKGIRRKIAIC